MRDQDKSKDFYVPILGGKVIKPDHPCYAVNLASDKQGDVRNLLGSAREAIRSLVRRAIKSGDIGRDPDANDFLRVLSVFPTWRRVRFLEGF